MNSRDVVAKFLSGLVKKKLNRKKIISKPDVGKIIVNKVIKKFAKELGGKNISTKQVGPDRTYYPTKEVSPEIWGALEKCRKEKEYRDMANKYIDEEVKKWGDILGKKK